MFPFTGIPAYNLPVYASQRPLPDATQDSVRGCSLGFCRGCHLRQLSSTRLQGATRTEPYGQLSCIRLPPRMFDGWPRPSVRAPASVTRFPGTVSGTCGIGSRSPWPPPFAPPPPLPVARPCSAASLLLWRSLTSHARASSASVPHLPDADQSALQPVAGHETSQVPTRSFRT